MVDPDAVILTTEAAGLVAEARQVALRWGLAWLEPGSAPPPPLHLRLADDGLSLWDTHPRAPGPLRVEFVVGAMGHRRRMGMGRRQPLARALGFKSGFQPKVVDATAGLGRDAFFLASIGARVTLLERHPVVAALLEDGLRRALLHPDTHPAAQRLTLRPGDAKTLLGQWPPAERPHAVYLDPMHPPRTKSALVKKEMRLLRTLVGDDGDSADLLAPALELATDRVVVKRPAGAAPFADRPPSFAIVEQTVRFDVYRP
ncbi:MAG: class I SAM-dependent methyltransferase [Magnetococcales bacterium]|nr:class I SAM-dependent methyltransferase [Magnetococcales bacterium]